jgi:hypothetical protein
VTTQNTHLPFGDTPVLFVSGWFDKDGVITFHRRASSPANCPRTGWTGILGVSRPVAPIYRPGHGRGTPTWRAATGGPDFR